ncbi:hypothetical protein LTR12_000699 [Friedmanniomyces endolithicus]|nr:hypothetical protein LTR12_000699 [Friedmanniomyces endolithicus]
MSSSTPLPTPPVGTWVHTDDLDKYPHLRFKWQARVGWHTDKALHSWDWKDYNDKPNKAPQPKGLVHSRDLHKYPDTHFEVAFAVEPGNSMWKGWPKTDFGTFRWTDLTTRSAGVQEEAAQEAEQEAQTAAEAVEQDAGTVERESKRRRQSNDDDAELTEGTISQVPERPRTRSAAHAKDNLRAPAVRPGTLTWTAKMRATLELIMTKIEDPTPPYDLKVAIFDTIFTDELKTAELATVSWRRMQTQRGTRNDPSLAKRQMWEEGMDVMRSEEGERLLERVYKVAAELGGEEDGGDDEE